MKSDIEMPEAIGRNTSGFLPPHPQAEKIETVLNNIFPRRRIERVLLVNPPDGESSLFRFTTARRRRYPNYPPYGLAVLAQHLRSIGVEPRILNLNHEVLKACYEAPSESEFSFDAVWRKLLAEEIEDFEPHLIGVTCMFTMTHQSLRKVCEAAAQSGVPVAIGGVHVSNDVERVMNDIPAARMAFLQEGDVAIKLFCKVVSGDLGVEHLGQIILDD
jgi:hypothetical protein